MFHYLTFILIHYCISKAFSSQSLISLNNFGTKYSPVNTNALLLATQFSTTTMNCAYQCYQQFACRIFNYDTNTKQCQLFEGDTIATGSIVSSSTSITGAINLIQSDFKNQGRTCDQCTDNRFFSCINRICNCREHTYWNGSMCLPQLPIACTECQTNVNMCRADLGLSCQFDTCDYLNHTCNNSATTAQTVTTTTTSISISSSLWSFDNNTLDSLSIFNGVSVNSSTYRTPGINGYGSALSVNGTTGQYVNVPTYRNLSYTSFTVELWFYSIALSSADYGFFGQYYASTADRSLHLIIRNYALYMGFWSDDLVGATMLKSNTWYHAAFVYDYSNLRQTVYLDENIDGTRSSAPFQGTSGSILIGMIEQISGYVDHFSGYIDEVSLVMRAKNASEILNDATLTTWQSFDNPSSYSDSGPLRLQVKPVNVTSVNGRVNQAISFISNSSYYQINGFVRLGVSNYSYSVALWTRPSSVRGSTLVHLSTTTNGQGWCIDLIGFSSSGQIIATGWNGSPQEVVGPILPANSWTHVALTYSSTNGIRLYVNGTWNGTSTSFLYSASGQLNIITLANRLQGNLTSTGGTCPLQSIVPDVYYGDMDEFRVYSRELNASDVHTLANP